MVQPFGKSLPEGKALVSLGSNATSSVGGPAETLEAALDALSAGPCRILARSRFVTSPFLPRGAEPDVVNAVIGVETTLSPRDFLATLHRIEAEFDRVRTARWTSRTLDLDLLAMGSDILPDPETVRRWIELAPADQRKMAPDEAILPHPRMQDRAFVLVPAAEVAPDWRHPLLGATIRDMLAALPADEVSAVRPLQP